MTAIDPGDANAKKKNTFCIGQLLEISPNNKLTIDVAGMWLTEHTLQVMLH